LHDSPDIQGARFRINLIPRIKLIQAQGGSIYLGIYGSVIPGYTKDWKAITFKQGLNVAISAGIVDFPDRSATIT
jgi:hypothetical protein